MCFTVCVQTEVWHLQHSEFFYLTITLSLSYAVQHECIPQAILGMDILCQAKSGMGKTAVFVLATLQQIEPVDGQVRYLRYIVLKWHTLCNTNAFFTVLSFEEKMHKGI